MASTEPIYTPFFGAMGATAAMSNIFVKDFCHINSMIDHTLI
jgi:hypothetical protein